MDQDFKRLEGVSSSSMDINTAEGLFSDALICGKGAIGRYSLSLVSLNRSSLGYFSMAAFVW